MTETYCDICGKKCVVKPYDMISGKENGEWKCMRVDVCDPCMDKLQELHGELERQFLHRKGKVNVVCEKNGRYAVCLVGNCGIWV